MSDRPEIDFDHYSKHFRDNWRDIADNLHATGTPIAWSNHHGGFWVVASWAAAARVAEDWVTFTSVNDLTDDENGGKGIQIPQGNYRLFLSESDPPFHTERRRLEAPYFTPKALRQWSAVAKQHLAEAINEVIERGSAELVSEIITPTTARTTLYLLGYDPNDWQDAALSAHAASYLLPDNPNYPHAEQARLRKRFRELLAERRSNPTKDLISSLANGTVMGEKLNDDQGESMLNALVFGGFDTTVALTTHALIWLSDRPDEVTRLLSDSSYMKNAIEEFLRFYPPTMGIARTAVKDTSINGMTIRKGEHLYLWYGGANRDPAKFTDPTRINLERDNANEHLSFSAGQHRCLGAPLAKAEITEMIRIIFTHIPDLKINKEDVEEYPSFGAINGFTKVPATFTPSKLIDVV